MFDQIHRSIRRYSAFLCLLAVTTLTAHAQRRTITVRKASINGVYTCQGHQPAMEMEWEGTGGSSAKGIVKNIKLKQEYRKLRRKNSKYTTYAINSGTDKLVLYYTKRNYRHFQKRFHNNKLHRFDSKTLVLSESKGKTVISEGKKILWVSFPLADKIECYHPRFIADGGPLCTFEHINMSVINGKSRNQKHKGRIIPRDHMNPGALSNNMLR